MPRTLARNVIEIAQRHPTRAAALFYALLAVALFGQALLGGRTLSSSDYLFATAPWESIRPDGVRPKAGANGELADAIAAFQPFFEHTRATLPDIPLWNSGVGLGRPFLANAQSAVFSPLSVPMYVLPFWWSLGLVAALKVWLAAFGTFLLGRRLGMRLAGALMAGLIYGFSLFFIAWLAWPLATVWAWMPLILLLTDSVITAPGRRSFALLALVVAAQFLGGHPESSFHVLATAVVFLGLRLAVLRRSGAIALSLRPLGLLLGAIVAGACVAGVAVIPFVELLVHSGDVSNRTGPSYVLRQYGLGLFINDYWGRPTGNSLQGFLVERGFYVGALPLMLAAGALLLRPTLQRVGAAVVATVALAVVLGVPPFFEVLSVIPGFDTAHNTRLTIVFALFVALLAGWALDDLVARARPVRGRVVLAVAAAIALVAPAVMGARGRLSPLHPGEALDVAWRFATPPSGQSDTTYGIIQQGALVVWLTFAGLAIALMLARRSRHLGATAFAALALLLVVADLFRADMGQNPAIPRDHAVQPETGAINALKDRRPGRFASIPRPIGIDPLPADVAMRYDLQDARSYDYPIERRYDTLWNQWVVPVKGFAPPTTVSPVTASSRPVLNLMGVSDFLQNPRDPPITGQGLRITRNGPDARIYRNEQALPRAFVVGAQVPVADGERALGAIGNPLADLRRVAVTEKPIAGIPRASILSGPAVPGRARITRYRDEQVDVRSRARRAGLLVLTDLHYPGWKATVDGRPTDIERVDYLMRGVRVPAGTHDIRFTYVPASFRAGWLLSLAGLALVGFLLVTGRRRP